METRAHPRLLTLALCALVAAAPLAGHHAYAQKAKAKPPETEVEGVTVTGVMVPVPQIGAGAPLITAAELEQERVEAKHEVMEASNAARICDPINMNIRLSIAQLYREEAEYQRALQEAADTAKARTVAATEARIAAGRGIGSQADVEATELARQKAVNDFLKKRNDVNEARARTADYQQVMQDVNRGDVMEEMIPSEMMLRAAVRPKADEIGFIIPTDLSDLVLYDVRASSLNDGKFMRITGRISNPRNKPIDIPALAFTAVDDFGIGLRTEVTGPGTATKIKPGSSAPFSYDFQPLPARTKTVVAAISDGKFQLMHLPANMFCQRSSATPDERNAAARANISRSTSDANITSRQSRSVR